MADKKGPAMRRIDASVEGFLTRVPDERRREDARRLCAMMQEVTGEPPVMWGNEHHRFRHLPLPVCQRP
jgi:hypothetical protein